MRDPGPMVSDVGPWSRLIEEHRQNLTRLEAGRPEPPGLWGLPLGVAVPFLLVLAAVVSREPNIVVAAVMCFALLIPFGLACLFVERLQPLATGLVLGIGGSLFATAALFG